MNRERIHARSTFRDRIDLNRVFFYTLTLAALGWLVGCGAYRSAEISSGELRPTSTVASRGSFIPAQQKAAPEHPVLRSADAAQPLITAKNKNFDEPMRKEALSPVVRLKPSFEEGDTPSLRVKAQGVQKLTLRLTPLTLGEALAFLRGGQVLTRRGKSTTLRPSGQPPRVDASVPLGEIDGLETGLVAADTEALSTGGEQIELSQLIQFSPLDVHAEMSLTLVQLTVSQRQNGTPISGALVELVDADGRALAQGRTDAAGALALTRPPVVIPALLGEGLYLTVRDHKHQALIEL